MWEFLEALKKRYQGTTMTESDLVFTQVDYEIEENDIEDPSLAYVRIQFTPAEDVFNWAKENEGNVKSLIDTMLKKGLDWAPDHFLFDVVVEELADESEGYTGCISGKLELEKIIKLK